jgi:hypothetical protein
MEVRQMSAQVLVSILALIVSVGSFSFAWISSLRAARTEEIKNLLGEKETVGFGALKLWRDGLPGESENVGRNRPKLLRERRKLREDRQRELIIRALMAACLFEGSDRARALLFKVIEKYRDSRFKDEFHRQYAEFKKTIDSMKTYGFNPKEFDPTSAENRLNAVKKVLYGDQGAPE